MSNVSLIDGHIDNAEHCVCCGQVIPEGRQHCVICGYKADNGKHKADLVNVVRCKDCIHKTVTVDGEYDTEDIVCGYHMSDGFCDNDYCSYGERKETE